MIELALLIFLIAALAYSEHDWRKKNEPPDDDEDPPLGVGGNL
jgi:hypothetical protein